MSVNRAKEHLVIYFEDSPYRSILNGIITLLNVNENVIDIHHPCGGWKKVFDSCEENIHLLNKFDKRFILLLMDFDDEDINSEISFSKRMEKFNSIVPAKHKNRVFLLGVNHKESEELKKHFKQSNFEEIGKILLKDCPDGDLLNWQNIHLRCNLEEINRMRSQGILNWLFQ